jgi:DNA-binding Lrp family transcriptional regulator
MSTNNLYNTQPRHKICIPEEIADDKRLSDHAKMLYGRLDSYFFNGCAVFMSNKTLAEKVNVSVRTIQYELNSLEKCGYIRIEYRNLGSHKTSRLIYPVIKPVVVGPEKPSKQEEDEMQKQALEAMQNIQRVQDLHGMQNLQGADPRKVCTHAKNDSQNTPSPAESVGKPMQTLHPNSSTMNSLSIINPLKREEPQAALPAKMVMHCKPTVEEIKAFCIENKLLVDPQCFHDFYESNGWLVGQNPMRSWQATARNWHRRKITEGNTHRAFQRCPGSTPQYNYHSSKLFLGDIAL